jgi:hypothetical protein
MKMNRSTILLAAALPVLVAVGTPCTIWAAESNSDIQQMIENAKTPADHQAIADYYDKQAATAKDGIKRHQQMLEQNKSNPAIVKHCRLMIRAYRIQEQSSKKLAQLHREMAK